MKFEFHVENVKCNGCVNAIQTGLTQDKRVKEVVVDIPTGLVSVTADEDIRAHLSKSLKTLGYPERA